MKVTIDALRAMALIHSNAYKKIKKDWFNSHIGRFDEETRIMADCEARKCHWALQRMLKSGYTGNMF